MGGGIPDDQLENDIWRVELRRERRQACTWFAVGAGTQHVDGGDGLLIDRPEHTATQQLPNSAPHKTLPSNTSSPLSLSLLSLSLSLSPQGRAQELTRQAAKHHL
jgi:hypothetical protein